MKLTEPQVRRWTLEEYYRLAEEGHFAGERVLLLAGEIIQMPPQGHAYTRAVSLAHDALRAAFPSNWIRVQMPLHVGEESDPEPDVAVLEGTVRELDAPPTRALLVVEVSDTTLRLDRRKAGVYAAAGVPEYWIVNLRTRQIEVNRSPIPDASAEFGHRYDDHLVKSENETISPIAASGATVRTGDLLP